MRKRSLLSEQLSYIIQHVCSQFRLTWIRLQDLPERNSRVSREVSLNSLRTKLQAEISNSREEMVIVVMKVGIHYKLTKMPALFAVETLYKILTFLLDAGNSSHVL